MFFVFFALLLPIVLAVEALTLYAAFLMVLPIFKIYQPTYTECLWIAGASFILRTWYNGLEAIGKNAVKNA